MNRRTFVKSLPALTLAVSNARGLAQDAPKTAAELMPIVLPKPETDGGKSVLAALKERKTTRNISAKELPPQVLSNLLWAALARPVEPRLRPVTRRRSICMSHSPPVSTYTRPSLTD